MHLTSLLIFFFVDFFTLPLGIIFFTWSILFIVYFLCCWLSGDDLVFFFFLYDNVTILSLLLKRIFANSRILDHELTFFPHVRDLVHCVLASTVSVEKMAISIIVAPLKVMSLFTMATFKMFTLAIVDQFLCDEPAIEIPESVTCLFWKILSQYLSQNCFFPIISILNFWNPNYMYVKFFTLSSIRVRKVQFQGTVLLTTSVCKWRLLEDGHTHLFMSYQCCFCVTTEELSSCDRGHMTHKT